MKGAVAGGSKETVQAGLDVLEAGGNAVDAAIASTLMAGVAEPLLTGLGGVDDKDRQCRRLRPAEIIRTDKVPERQDEAKQRANDEADFCQRQNDQKHCLYSATA